ncbi:MAG: zinc-ribbon domain-containing protein, partial [Clostridia bacterium]|nr:zinc-ribbon domain-containing protein [Clostridia bacterium]
FCPGCGAKIERKRFCSECGAEISSQAKFCPECGNKL